MSTLFFHFDGTENDLDDAFAPADSASSLTNVLKSHLLLGVQPHHRSFYYAGIGTYGNWLEQRFNAAFAIENGHILHSALRDFKA